MPVPHNSGAELLRSWNHCHGAFFRCSESDLLWNLEKQDWMHYQIASLAGVPVLWAEAAENGERFGISKKGLWLGLYGEIPAGEEPRFAEEALAHAQRLGKTRLGIGGDEFHFTPGIPEEGAGPRLIEAFQALSFSVADCADFVGAPSNPKSHDYIEGALAEGHGRRWRFHEVEQNDWQELSAFLEREFPGRWLREWKLWQIRPDMRASFWNLLRDEQGTVIGFSRLAIRGGAGMWTPGALRLPLSGSGEREDTDSCLGPIGIAKDERGRGAGKILLGSSLHALSLRGAKRTCIDWTNAYNYYTPLGFEVVRRYSSVWKNL